MPEITITQEFGVWCATCGRGLCNEATVSTDRYGKLRLEVEACPDCTAKARDEGYRDGHDDGFDSAGGNE